NTMDEKLEQCSAKGVSNSTSTEIATCNQEVPEDLKSKLAVAAEARKAGKTPSSVDLPKFDLSDVKADSVVAQNKLPVSEQLSTPADAPVCTNDGDSKLPAEKDAGEKPVSTQTDDQ